MAEKPSISLVLEHLNRTCGCALSADYYNRINEWKQWWRGYYKPFHRIREWDGEKNRYRDLYTLKMAKKVCEDWAAVLLNEKTELVLKDTGGSVFLQGETGTGGVLGENDFWVQGNALVEKAFATGTGAFVLKLHNMGVNAAGDVLRGGEAGVRIEYLDASCIIPLSARGGRVTEAAFVSEVMDRGKRFIYLETHTLEGGSYLIQNEYFRSENGALVEAALPAGVAPVLRTNSDIPWFALVSPNLVNNIPRNNGLGMSVFANAVDNLKGVDLAFNNFCRDFKLGGKKVFYNQQLVHTDENGRTVTPDDVAQQLFMQLGDDFIDKNGNNKLIHEFNPDLRVEGNRTGVQAQLDYLSFKCGLGARRYRFEAGSVQTATEYTGSQQEMIQNANKHYISVERALQTLVRGILHIGKAFCGAATDPDTEITVNFEDSYIIDKESERQRDLQEVRDGLMMPWEFRVKWRGETEAEAKRILSEKRTDDGWMDFKEE